jgi:hypothetical protein
VITTHLNVWALLATLVVGFVLGAVVQAAYAKWKLRRDLDLTGDPGTMELNPEDMSDEGDVRPVRHRAWEQAASPPGGGAPPGFGTPGQGWGPHP